MMSRLLGYGRSEPHPIRARGVSHVELIALSKPVRKESTATLGAEQNGSGSSTDGPQWSGAVAPTGSVSLDRLQDPTG